MLCDIRLSSSATVVSRDAASAVSRAVSPSVRVGPGCTTVTLIPNGPSSSARFLVMAETLTLRTVCATELALRAARPLTLMMRPQPAVFMCGTTARAARR